MAEDAVSLVIGNVKNYLNQEGTLVQGVRDQVMDMQVEMEFVHGFLKHAEQIQEDESCLSERRELVRNWVSEIREVAYNAEDVIERFVLKSDLRKRSESVISKMQVFSINHAMEVHRVESLVEGIKTKLSNLRKNLQDNGVNAVSEEATASSSRTHEMLGPEYDHISDHNVLGLDEKVTLLVEGLVDAKQASVVVVYGASGVGKTTAAKLVYNDCTIRAHFQGFAWVYISQKFNQIQAWETILIQLTDKTKREVEMMNEDALMSQLRRVQTEHRCLIVFDNIDNQSLDWDDLYLPFNHMAKESTTKILVTTCNATVANRTDAYGTRLDSLNEVTSLKLLQNTILLRRSALHSVMKVNYELDKFAEEMVKKCRGVRRDIVRWGNIIGQKYDEWEKGGDISILYRSLEVDNIDYEGISMVLEQSYKVLPRRLKSCFLYFSQFRGEEEIKGSDLVQKWIAEGFVMPSTRVGGDGMEEVADNYLNELQIVSMVQVQTRRHTGRVKMLEMRDLMRDLCISKAKEEDFVHTITLGSRDDDGTNLVKANCRRLCVCLAATASYCKIEESNSSSLFLQQLRSISFHIDDTDSRSFDSQCKRVKSIANKLKSVRVLQVTTTSHVGATSTSHGLDLRNLLHLRFLKLEVPILPASVASLRCLQTLKLQAIKVHFKIPDSVWELEQLRHLYLPQRCSCESSKQRVCNFPNLQTLLNFPPEKFNLEQNLVKFTNVMKLGIIRCSENIGKIIRSKGFVFNRLQSLSLRRIYSSEHVHFEDITRRSPRLRKLAVDGIIHSLVTKSAIWTSYLTKLVLGYSELDENPVQPLVKLQFLRVLVLHHDAFTGKDIVFRRNSFPRLRRLVVEELRNLQSWAVHQGALRSLDCLEIVNCENLESVPEGSQFLKQLKKLKVKDMAHSFRQRLEKGGEDWDRISHVHSISFHKSDKVPEDMADQ